MTAPSLIARLEGAAEGSRELDGHVWAAVNGYELIRHDGAGWLYKMGPDDIVRHERTGYISPFTTSLDAALALTEQVLPGWQKVIGQHDQPGGRGPAWKASLIIAQGGGLESAWAATPALALCAAILKATTNPTDEGAENG